MFKRIYFFFLVYVSVTGYAQTLFFLWFKDNGVSYTGLLLVSFLNFFPHLIIYFLLDGRTLNTRLSMFLGIAFSGAAVFVASIMPSPHYAYISGFFFSITGVFFWTVFNSIFFRYSKEGEYGFKSGLYFLLFPLSGALFSPLSGIIASHFGYAFFYKTALLAYSLPLILVFYLPESSYKFSTREAVFRIENKILIFFQGFSGMLGMALIPIFTLYFIFTTLGVGNFFGYLALLSALVAVLNSKIRDRLNKKAFFFYLFSFLNSLSYLPIYFLSTLFGWQIFTGINSITSNLANPFDTALILDTSSLDIDSTMLAREFYLSLGRVVMLALAILILWISGSFYKVLLVTALASIAYPLIAYHKKVYLTPNQSKLG